MSRDHDHTFERLFEVATLLTDALDRGLAERGLTRARAEVVWRVHHQGPMTQRQLSELLQCTPRNVTGLVDALESQGLVERRRHPDDRRAVLVALTPRGEDTVRTWLSSYQSEASKLFAVLERDEFETFARALDRIADRLRDTAT